MDRRQRARRAQSRGVAAETAVCIALERDGWSVLARRLRTGAGEVDVVAQRDGLLAIVEVKARRHLADAAVAVSARQQARLVAAAAVILADHPDWGAAGVRFDLLLVDGCGRIRRIADAFRADT